MYEDGNYVDNLIYNNAIEQEQEEMTNLLGKHGYQENCITGRRQRRIPQYAAGRDQ